MDRDFVIAKASDALAKNRHIVFAYLFGSVSRDAVTPMSDIDIAVYLVDVQKPVEVKLDILGHLMAALETDDIDLVVLNAAPLTLKARVLQNKVVLVDRDPYFRHSFESLTLREYLDFSIFETTILNRRFVLG